MLLLSSSMTNPSLNSEDLLPNIATAVDAQSFWSELVSFEKKRGTDASDEKYHGVFTSFLRRNPEVEGV